MTGIQAKIVLADRRRKNSGLDVPVQSGRWVSTGRNLPFRPSSPKKTLAGIFTQKTMDR
jgi:hypothetical protein